MKTILKLAGLRAAYHLTCAATDRIFAASRWLGRELDRAKAEARPKNTKVETRKAWVN